MADLHRAKDPRFDSASKRKAAFQQLSDSAFVTSLLQKHANGKNFQGRWREILVFLTYYNAMVENNPHSWIFSFQMLGIATRAYNNREEFGGWAGDFTYSGFKFAVDEMKTGTFNWFDPPDTVTSDHSEWIHDVWSAEKIGDHHFKRHLAPGFKSYVDSAMQKVIAGRKTSMFPVFTNSGMRQQDPRDFEANRLVGRIIAEHELFLRYAVTPAMNANYRAGTTKGQATIYVVNKVRNLRWNVLNNALRNFEYATKKTFRSKHYFARDYYSRLPITWPPNKEMKQLGF